MGASFTSPTAALVCQATQIHSPVPRDPVTTTALQSTLEPPKKPSKNAQNVKQVSH